MSQRLSLLRGDLVLVQFPFTDLSAQKLRPALIVGRVTGDDVIVAFISSRISRCDPRAEHVLDPTENEFRATGLKGRSLIRLNKVATLHRALSAAAWGESALRRSGPSLWPWVMCSASNVM